MLTSAKAALSEGSFVLESDLELELVGVIDYEGRPALPAFTSEAALLHWQPAGGPFVELPGRIVAQLLLQGEWDRIVVDTETPNAHEITRGEAAALLGR